jgi:hypothetical protein
LLETQAPSTNTQWLNEVEQVQARAQQMRIKAVPPRTPAEPHEECKDAPLREVRTRCCNGSVRSDRRAADACVSFAVGLDFYMPQQPRAQPLLPVLVVMESEGQPYLRQLQACPRCQQPQQPTADHITQLCAQAAWLAQRQNTDVNLLFDKPRRAQDFYSKLATVQGILRLSSSSYTAHAIP